MIDDRGTLEIGGAPSNVRWRAVTINMPRLIDEHGERVRPSLRQWLRFVWGHDVFLSGVPVVKVGTLWLLVLTAAVVT